VPESHRRHRAGGQPTGR